MTHGGPYAEQRQIAAKVRARLALPCILFMLMSSLDRANISFAATRMNADLGFTPTQYGFGAGILFAGFLAGQYPSLWLLQRVGMRRWICALRAAVGSVCRRAGIHRDARAVLRAARADRRGRGRPRAGHRAVPQPVRHRARARHHLHPAGAGHPGVGDHRRAAVGLAARNGTRSVDAGLALHVPGRGRAHHPASASLALVLFSQYAGAGALLSTRAARLAAAPMRAQRADAPRSATTGPCCVPPIVVLAGLLWFCLLCGSYGVIFWLPQVIQLAHGSFDPSPSGSSARCHGSAWPSACISTRAIQTEPASATGMWLRRRWWLRRPCSPRGRWDRESRRWCCCWSPVSASAVHRVDSGRYPRSCCAPRRSVWPWWASISWAVPAGS